MIRSLHRTQMEQGRRSKSLKELYGSVLRNPDNIPKMHTMLRLGQVAVAARPPGEVYLLESEVMTTLGKKTLEDL